MSAEEPSAPVRTYTRANRGQNPHARWIVDEAPTEAVTKKRKTSAAKKQTTTDEAAEDNSVRCSCRATKYDPEDARIMAECESCSKWQHVECMIGINDERQLPEPYSCWMCQTSDLQSSGPPSQAAEQAKQAVKQSKAGPPITPEVSKVRDSVRTALNKIFSDGLVEQAVELSKLPQDTDISEYSAALAGEIESSIYSTFAEKGRGVKDIGKAYRAQFRTLSFNLRDQKNHELQLRVTSREIDPQIFARMTSEQMLSPDLQRLAEEVRLESIRESVLKTEDAPRLRKTHKGDELIDEDDNDPRSPLMTSIAPDAPVDFDYDPVEDMPDDINDYVVGPPQPEEKRKKPQGPNPSQNSEVRYDQVQQDDFVYSPPSENDYGISDADEDTGPQNSKNQMGQANEQSLSSTDQDKLGPLVWEGGIDMGPFTVELCSACHLNNPVFQPSWWSACFDNSQNLRVGGRLNREIAAEYLLLASKSRVVAGLLLKPLADSKQKLDRLYDDLIARQKVGVMTGCSDLVKDAYVVPLEAGTADAFLATLKMTDDTREFLSSLAETSSEKLILGIFVLPDQATLERAM